jgi:hypothetical protein
MALVLALASPLALAQGEAAVTRRATELREAPASSGRSLAALPAQSPLTRLGERQGPWVQVRTEAGATGWLHLFDVGPATSAAGNMASARCAASPACLPGRSVECRDGASLDHRGARAGRRDLAGPARPAAVGHMESLRQNENQARAFAKAAALRPVAVDALPAPSGPGPALRSSDPSNPQSP